jgi:hypothetical protein
MRHSWHEYPCTPRATTGRPFDLVSRTGDTQVLRIEQEWAQAVRGSDNGNATAASATRTEHGHRQ